MKKILISTLLVVPMIAGMSTAMAARDNVGCGLGSSIFDGQSGIGPQVLAVTTNGTLGNQTFGISSGTLGCQEGGVVTASAAVNMFVASNLDSLSRDMSVGQGESLESLASLMGIQAQDKASFFSATRTNYSKIFSSHNLKSGQVLDNLFVVISETQGLQQYVRS